MGEVREWGLVVVKEVSGEGVIRGVKVFKVRGEVVVDDI